MFDPSFVFTILFLLLGPIKLIPGFANVVQGKDDRFSRTVAVYGFLVASAVVAFLTLVGGSLLGRYQISAAALNIAGGLVLLLSALNTIFPKSSTAHPGAANATPLQLAVSPLSAPIIVAPAGVAAILIFVMVAPEHPGLFQALAISLAIIMVLDLIVMYFNRQILKTPGLTMVLSILGAVLVFVQVALAVDTIVGGFTRLGVIPSSP